MININIGENIKKYRKERKLTQIGLAEVLSKSESTIQKYESGKVIPDTSTLIKIAVALDVNIADLLGQYGVYKAKDGIVIETFESDSDIPEDTKKYFVSMELFEKFLNSIGYTFNELSSIHRVYLYKKIIAQIELEMKMLQI